MQIRKRMQATRDKSAVRRWTALLLCAALLGSTVSSALPVQAANEGEEETYCEHHPEHTGECGYVEAVEGHPCEHEHNEECGYSEETACTHEHDDTCGYIEAVEEQPCQFVCEICEGGPKEVPEDETEQEEVPSADESTAAEDEVIETTTESIATATEPMPSTATQKEGLIAHFTFDESGRLTNSANSGVTASLREVTKGVPAVGNKVRELEDYFDNDDDDNTNALHLKDDACLVLEENEDCFDDMTELTVEMKIKIIKRDSQDTSSDGTDANWLFYAAQREGVAAADRCLGVTLTNEQKLRILRQTKPENKEYGENDFPTAFAYGQWYTIRIIYKPSNVALYVDNKRIVDKGLVNKTSEYFYKGGKLWFGHSDWPGDTNFNGYMDDIKIYNYANYNTNLDDPDGSYLEGYIESYIEEHNVIVEGMNPPNTTVNMFDYWIIGQKDNDFNPPLSLDDVRDNGVNENHLFLFAGYCAADGGVANSSYDVGSWNSYIYSGASNHQKYEPFPGIVNNVLDSKGYPRLDIAGIEDAKEMFLIPSTEDDNNSNPNDKWYENIVNKDAGKKTESLAYLFEPVDDESFKAAYPNVTGLFREVGGYYIFRCGETFAELNSDQDRRPKKSKGKTGNNKITLYNRVSGDKDFFPFNDATDLFYVDMGGELKKANEDANDQASTDEPFNHYFGMTVETTFEQPIDGRIDPDPDLSGDEEEMNFHFSGDDDVWIFIDNVLVADAGGLHNEIDIKINFATGEIDFTGYQNNSYSERRELDGSDSDGSGMVFDTTLYDMFAAAGKANSIKWKDVNGNKLFPDGSKHTLKFFYLERGNALSHCTIEFNMQRMEEDTPTDKPKPPKKKDTPKEQSSSETVMLNVSTESPKANDKAVIPVALTSPNTGDSNMVLLWFALLVFSPVGMIAIYRTRKRKD